MLKSTPYLLTFEEIDNSQLIKIITSKLSVFRSNLQNFHLYLILRFLCLLKSVYIFIIQELPSQKKKKWQISFHQKTQFFWNREFFEIANEISIKAATKMRHFRFQWDAKWRINICRSKRLVLKTHPLRCVFCITSPQLTVTEMV